MQRDADFDLFALPRYFVEQCIGKLEDAQELEDGPIETSIPHLYCAKVFNEEEN